MLASVRQCLPKQNVSCSFYSWLIFCELGFLGPWWRFYSFFTMIPRRFSWRGLFLRVCFLYVEWVFGEVGLLYWSGRFANVFVFCWGGVCLSVVFWVWLFTQQLYALCLYDSQCVFWTGWLIAATLVCAKTSVERTLAIRTSIVFLNCFIGFFVCEDNPSSLGGY